MKQSERHVWNQSEIQNSRFEISMKQSERDIGQISAILKGSFLKERAEGVTIGLRVAERIANWYSENQNLQEPHSQEKIESWVQEELAKLKQEIVDLQKG